jgi:thiol-disulfide isomerase/thioredoxin
MRGAPVGAPRYTGKHFWTSVRLSRYQLIFEARATSVSSETLGRSTAAATQRVVVPASVIRAVRLRREGRLAEAISITEASLTEARATPLDIPFRDRVLLGLTLADLYVMSERPDRARSLLGDEVVYAQQIHELIRQTGSAEQVRAATTGYSQLRDVAAQLALLANAPPEIVADWVQGEPATLAALRGRVVLIEFWARWCRSCVSMFPVLSDLQERYGDRGLTILALTRYGPAADDPSAERIRERDLITRMVGERCPGIAVGIAPDGGLQEKYGANRMPAVVLIDRKGIVQFASSISDKAKLAAHISNLIEKDI